MPVRLVRRLARLDPPQVLALAFAGAIGAGTLLLSFPWATADGRGADWSTALFTAASAVCVTGLVVVDTGTYWSPAGQAVILALMQAGGLGLMTFAVAFWSLLGVRVGLRQRLLLREQFQELTVAGMVRLSRAVLVMALTIQGLGAALLAVRFVPELGPGRGLWFAVFHAVSGFNNAGFDLIGGFRSLVPYALDPLVSGTVAGLVVLGGLGFHVLQELADRIGRRRRGGAGGRVLRPRLSLHSRVVLVVTAVLLVVGTAGLAVLEWSNSRTLERVEPPARLWLAAVQSVMPRTAGFSVLPVAEWRPATRWGVIGLMLIGASPGSTGSGIKTTTFAVLLALALAALRGGQRPILMERAVPLGVALKAVTVAVATGAAWAGLVLFLLAGQRLPAFDLAFEAASALANVGLSTGVTPELTPAGRLAVVVAMYAGRVGPLTLAYAVGRTRGPRPGVGLPEEGIMVG